MKSLRVLGCGSLFGYICGIDQNGIKGLNLTKLYAFNNSKISDVSWMSNLIELDCRHACGIDQNGIKGLELKILNIELNPNFKNIDVSTYLE